MPLLLSQDVTKDFGNFKALQGVTLSVNTGECVALLGPNGAGKSTFISLVYGAALRTAGQLTVFGIDPAKNSRDIKRRLGVVPQENALDDELTVVENMRLFARFLGLHAAEANRRIEELLVYLSLDHKKDAQIRTLSGGMKRRLAFVRALLGDPELLILDEPTTGLDPAVRHLLWRKVGELRKLGKTILITTHYMHEAEVLCDRIIVLAQGKIVGEGAPGALIHQHSPGFVALYQDRPDTEETLRSKMPASWKLYRQQDSWCLRAPDINELVAFQQTHRLTPLQLRPANLEDVFLKITGEELSQND